MARGEGSRRGPGGTSRTDGRPPIRHLLLLALHAEGLTDLLADLAAAGVAVTHWTDLELASARPLRPPADAVVCAALPPGRRADLVRSALSYARVHRVPALLLLQGVDGAEELLSPGGTDAADDFLLPPFRAAELLLRCRRALGRYQDGAPPSGTLQVGAVELDPGTYRVSVQGRLVSLTFREFELLRYLMERPGQYVTRDVLLDRVWGADFQGSLRTVDVHIWRLRTKLGLEGESFIESLRGAGYRIRPAPA